MVDETLETLESVAEFSWWNLPMGREAFLSQERDPFLIWERPKRADVKADKKTTMRCVPHEEETKGPNFRTVASKEALQESVDFRCSMVFRVHKSDRNPFVGMITIGRSPNNDIVLPLPSVSKFHAQFVQGAPGQWCIIDAGSTNGTENEKGRLVKGQRCDLKDGDSLLFGGEARLRFFTPEGIYSLLGFVQKICPPATK
jgi:hypothetical protein